LAVAETIYPDLKLDTHM